MKKQLVFAWVLMLAVAFASAAQQSDAPDNHVRQLLLEMKGDHRSTDQLGALFQLEGDRLADLIMALDDPNKEIRFSAQIAIRYLGNPEGMTRWVKSFESDKEGSMTGPIPIPLLDWDYEFIRSLYLRPNVRTEALMEAYLFALSLDGSPRANQLLSDVIANANKHGFKLNKSRFLQVRTIRIAAESDLAQAVLKQATFLDPADRQYTTARLIANTAAKDKAFVEIYVNRGPLAKVWYHVVVSRCEQGWRFFSITEVAIS